NIIFGSGNDVNKEYLSKVKSNFGTYFINEGYKYGWNFEKIYEEHPSFFQGDQIISGKKNKEGNMPEFTEMYEAIDHEIAASKEDARANIIPIISLEKIKLQNGTRVYVVKLDIQQDEDPKLVEG